MQTWQEIVLDGNKCFDQHRWYDAEAHYASALEQLESLWRNDKENPQLMMGWIAAMHNLSSLYERQGRDQAALRPLMQSYKTVMVLMEDKTLNDEFKYYLSKAARTTLLPLLEFSKTRPICDCCKASLEASWQKLQLTHYVLH